MGRSFFLFCAKTMYSLSETQASSQNMLGPFVFANIYKFPTGYLVHTLYMVAYFSGTSVINHRKATAQG